MEWSPIRSVIKQVINKIGRPQSRSPICQSGVNHDNRQTELDDKKFCCQLIITVLITKNKKIYLSQISPVETLSKVKIFLNFGSSSIFFKDKCPLLWLLCLILWLVDLAGWTLHDWLLQLSNTGVQL